MLEDSRSYFVNNVLPDFQAYDQFRQRMEAGINNDLRLAAAAATSMAHLSDHLFDELRGTPGFTFSQLGDYHSHLKSLCLDFDLLKDCANAYKHRNLTKKNAKVRRFQDIAEFVVLTEYTDHDGPYRVATKEVRVKLSDGTQRVLYDVLRNVRNMWFDELERRGVAFTKNAGPSKSIGMPPRCGSSGAANLNLMIRRGEPFMLTMELRSYDPATDTSSPIDLTGWQVQASIRAEPQKAPHFLSKALSSTAIENSVSITLWNRTMEQ